jgi:hypothetical protein
MSPETGEGLSGSGLLRVLLRPPAPRPEPLATDNREGGKGRVVDGAFALHLVVHLPSAAREDLLQLRLRIQRLPQRVLELLLEGRDHRRLDRLEPAREEERADRGFDHRGEDVAALGDVGSLWPQTLVQPQLLGDCGAALPGDDLRPQLRELTLRELLEALVERPRDRELEDAVPQELEPLVGLEPLVRLRRMREDARAEVGRQAVDQLLELCATGAR